MAVTSMVLILLKNSTISGLLNRPRPDPHPGDNSIILICLSRQSILFITSSLELRLILNSSIIKLSASPPKALIMSSFMTALLPIISARLGLYRLNRQLSILYWKLLYCFRDFLIRTSSAFSSSSSLGTITVLNTLIREKLI